MKEPNKYQFTRTGKSREHHHQTSGSREHHHQTGEKFGIEKGASPPNSRSWDQDRVGSITTKYQEIRIEEGASPPNIRA